MGQTDLFIAQFTGHSGFCLSNLDYSGIGLPPKFRGCSVVHNAGGGLFDEPLKKTAVMTQSNCGVVGSSVPSIGFRIIKDEQ